MRPGGKEGKGYSVEFGAEIVAVGALPAAGWYWITGRAAVGSGLPSKDPAISDGEDIGVDDFFWGDTATVLVSGDKVKPMTLTPLGFCRDIDSAASKQKFEDTTQQDVASGSKSFTESNLAEITGSISGYYETGSEAQEEIERRFKVVIQHGADGKVTRRPTLSGVWPFMLSRRETTEVGEVEIWEYKPMIVDSLSQKKPLEGTQEFNFNYTIDGKSHPAVYKRVIAA